MPPVGRVVGVRLVGRAALHPTVQHQLEPPHPQPVVPEAAVHPQPLDQVNGGVGTDVVGDPNQRPGPDAQRPGLPGGLVDAELVDADQRLPDRPHAQRCVGGRSLPQPFHQRLRRERRHLRQHPVDGRALQHAVELAVVAVANGTPGRVGGGRGDAGRLQRHGVGDRQMAAAAGQYRMVGAGSVQLDSGRQAPLGQVRFVPGDRGLHPLPCGGPLSRSTDRGGELGEAAGLADRDQRRVLGRLQQVLVGVAERRQQRQVRTIHHPGGRSDQAVQAMGVGCDGHDLGAAHRHRAVDLSGPGHRMGCANPQHPVSGRSYATAPLVSSDRWTSGGHASTATRRWPWSVRRATPGFIMRGGYRSSHQ